MRHIASFSGGKDSTAMVLRLIEEGYPLDEIVFFDTGWEFPDMYDHIEAVENYIGRKIVILKPKMSFMYWLLDREIIARKGPQKGQVHRVGNGWPSPTRRWCTREKVAVLDKYCDNAKRYIGFAADESRRVYGKTLNSAKYKCIYPLIDWDMSEDECLAYCYERGFYWNGLYDVFRRVSCFCCPLQRISELRKLRRHYNHLWQQMILWDASIAKHNKGFRGYKSVADLEKRFVEEDRQGLLFDCGVSSDQ